MIHLIRILLLFTCLMPLLAQASHNLAGQITYTRVSVNHYEILLTTYTDPTTRGVDNCTADLEIWTADGNTLLDKLEKIPRENGPMSPCAYSSSPCDAPMPCGVFIRPHIKKNYYRVKYRFNGPGIFVVRYYNSARVEYAKNFNNPNNNVNFFVETQLNNTAFIGPNNSPVLLNDPIDDACTGKLWTHNPGGYDPDGDSLAYSLIDCRQYAPPSLSRPIVLNGFVPLDGNFGGSFKIDVRTGIVTWNTPQQVGWYNFAILIQEYRNGRLIGYVVRDMAVYVDYCRNDPPIIKTIDDTCVLVPATEYLRFDIRSWDPNDTDSLYFYLNNGGEGNNGPFNVDTLKARLFPETTYPVKTKMPQQVVKRFEWQVDCAHVRRSFYQIDFYAHDNLRYDPTLAANHAITITVRPRPVTNFRLRASTRKIILNWDAHPCENAIGYEIYRKDGADDSAEDASCCANGSHPNSLGYERIAYLKGRNVTEYIDDSLAFRGLYCYRIIAVFPDNVKSCASVDTCIRILRDIPVLINNSIRNRPDTVEVVVAKPDADIGKVVTRWVRPDTNILNTEIFPPPYWFKLFRGDGLTGAVPAEVTPDFLTFNDTSHVDTALDTPSRPYHYLVRFYDSTKTEVSYSDPASSIFLTTMPSHQSMRLLWTETTPWRNTVYYIYRRKQRTEPDFRLIDSMIVRLEPDTIPIRRHTYLDRDTTLKNDTTYCYFIRSVGGYDNELSPLDTTYNDSNLRCDVPRDTTPPCLPGSSVDSLAADLDCDNFSIRFHWKRPNTFCDDDLAFYTLYFSKQSGGPYTRIGQTDGPDVEQYLLNQIQLLTIRGCYVLTATDRIGNESRYTQEFCFDHCPVFELPNVFTPGGDGVNNIFRVISMRSVITAEFSIYDRWGVLLHTSTDPYNLWDGTNKNGQDMPVGQYFYRVDLTLDNNKGTKLIRTGSVTLMR